MHCKLTRVVAVLTMVLVTLGLYGCADIPQTIAEVTDLRNRAEAVQQSVSGDVLRLVDTLAALPPDAPERTAVETAIATAQTRLATLEAAIRHADLVLAEMTSPSDGITQGVSAISTLLPPPAQGPVLLGAALVATLLRARQVRRGAASIAGSIHTAMKHDPAFREAFASNADRIRSIQTPVAQRIVDEATREGFMMRSPI